MNGVLRGDRVAEVPRWQIARDKEGIRKKFLFPSPLLFQYHGVDERRFVREAIAARCRLVAITTISFAQKRGMGNIPRPGEAFAWHLSSMDDGPYRSGVVASSVFTISRTCFFLVLLFFNERHGSFPIAILLVDFFARACTLSGLQGKVNGGAKEG